jgi:hypothetical protein
MATFSISSAREGLTSFRDTLDEARRFLRAPRAPSSVQQDRRLRERDTVVLVRKIWAASNLIAGTPAEAYLRARKITADFDDAPLRYHPGRFIGTLPTRCPKDCRRSSPPSQTTVARSPESTEHFLIRRATPRASISPALNSPRPLARAFASPSWRRRSARSTAITFPFGPTASAAASADPPLRSNGRPQHGHDT